MALSVIIRGNLNRLQHQVPFLKLSPPSVNVLGGSFVTVNHNKSFSQLLKPVTSNGNGTGSSLAVAVAQRQMSGSHGDHSKLWTIEKALSVSLLGIIPVGLALPNPVLDNLMAVASVIHFHWGLEACVIDYVRPIIFGNVIPKLTLGLLYLISATTLGGLIYYNVNDIGIGKTFQKLWAVKE